MATSHARVRVRSMRALLPPLTAASVLISTVSLAIGALGPAQFSGSLSWRLARASRERSQSREQLVSWIGREPGPHDALIHGAVAHAKAGRIDLAIDLLEYRLTLPPENAAAWSDLGAAYLTRAVQTGSAEDLPRALDAANRAARLAPGLLEANVNLALILEALGARDQATHVWLKVARDSPRTINGAAGADYARALRGEASRSDAMTQAAQALARHEIGRVLQSCRNDAQALREVLETVGWPRWARLVAAGDPRADRELEFLQLAGNCLARAGGDRLSLAMARHVSHATSSSARQIAHAFLEYDEGRVRYDSDDFRGAQPYLWRAAGQLADTGSPFATRARFQYGLTLYYAGRLSEASDIFAAVDHEAQANGYASLAGRAAWLRGLMRSVPSHVDARLLDYGEALSAFQRSGERPHAAAVEMLLAETYQLYGDRRQAWSHRVAALQGLGVTYDKRRRHSIWLDASRACLSENLPDAARWFTQQMLAEARAWGRAAPITEALGEQARIALRLQDADAALADAEAAMHALQRVADSSLRARLEPFVVATLAEATLASNPARARQLADAAIESHRRGARGHHIPTLRRLRASTYLVEGRRDRAWKELEAALADLDEHRGALSDRGTRLAYADSTWTLREDAVRLKLEQADANGAFEILERGRARELIAPQAQPGHEGLTTTRLSAALPTGHALLSFLVLNDRLVSWCVAQRRSTFSEYQISRTSLAALVAARRAVLDGTVEKGAVGTPTTTIDAIVDAALTPCSSRSHTLLVVPDDVLWSVPFAALTDSRSGRPLFDRYRITVGPSASALLALGHHFGRAPLRARALALVGDAEGEGLAALPHVRREAAAVVKFYGVGAVARAEGMTPSALVDLASDYDIVHFAGHARIDGVNPELSHLVLRAATPTHRPAYLFPRDLSGRRLRKTRVVVLAACQTGNGRLSRSEGGLSMARPFLEAGAAAVVASLWDVDDRATAVLMEAFHRGLSRHGDPSQALRQAQQLLQASSDKRLRTPSAWASFYVIGGVPGGNPAMLSVSHSRDRRFTRLTKGE